MPVADVIKRANLKFLSSPTRAGPLWEGPESDGPQGGVTFSLLSRFLQCRERFRLLVVEGLRPADAFNHRMEYGNMWHACEEEFAGTRGVDVRGNGDVLLSPRLHEHVLRLAKKFPMDRDKIEHWHNVCKVQFPLYVMHWSKHPDAVDRVPIFQEHVFKVPFELPSGRTVFLRGKWDAVDQIGKGKDAGVYLQENKTKGEIREDQVKRQLSFDLQTMLYLIALRSAKEMLPEKFRRWFHAVRGVRYNVVRRPLSGGKGTIVRHKPTKKNPAGESKGEFYQRLRGIIAAEPQTYFMRWRVEITDGDVERFKTRCLNPLLEQLCDWWEFVRGQGRDDPFVGYRSGGDVTYLHWQHPFGVRNVLDEGGSTDLDEHLASGSEVGLKRADNLFEELT